MNNELLRHMISTIQYRFEKSIMGSHPNFGFFSLGNGCRTPNEIINHMYEVIHLTSIFIEEKSLPEVNIERLSFSEETERFKNELVKVKQLLEIKYIDINYSKRLLQGPFSDVLTHIGQISMLQRIVDNPIEKEDFSKSEI